MNSRITVTCVLIVCMAKAGFAQIGDPGDQVAPSAYSITYNQLVWYETVECAPMGEEMCDELPSPHLYGYANQLDHENQLGCGTNCKRKTGTTPVEVMFVYPGRESKKTKVETSIEILRKRLSGNVIMVSPNNSAKLKDLNNPKLEVYFDDLILETQVLGKTLYFECLAASYRRTPSITIPIMLAGEIEKPQNRGIDGVGKFVINLGNPNFEIQYEVAIGLGSRKTRKTLAFNTVVLLPRKNSVVERKQESPSDK